MLDQERYNQEIEEIKRLVDQSLVGCDIDEQYRDCVYNSVYGFKVSVAEPYGIDMEHIYGSLSRLGSLKEDINQIPDMAYGLCSYYRKDDDGNRIQEDRPANIYISPQISGDKEYVQRVISHELIHLYSFDYAAEKHNLRDAHIAEECATEAINDKILNALSIVAKTSEVEKGCNFLDSSNGSAKSYGGGYSNIVPLYQALTTAYPEGEFIKVKFGAAEHYGDGAQSGLNTLSKDLETINNGNRIEDYGKFYKDLSFQLFNNYSANKDFSSYLDDARKIGETSPRISIGDSTYRISDIGFEPAEVAFLYKNSFINRQHNNIDVNTRTTDCQNFLKALSIAKQVDDNFSVNDLLNASTSNMVHNGQPSVGIQIGGNTYIAPRTNSTNNLVSGAGDNFSEESVKIKSGFHLAAKNDNNINYILLAQMTESFNGGFLSRWNDASKETLISASSGIMPDNNNILNMAINKNNVSDIHDCYGHNLLHAASSATPGVNFMIALRHAEPQTFNFMLREKDNDGATPIDVMCSSCNMYALREAVSSTMFTENDCSHLFDKVKIDGVDTYPIVKIMRTDEKLASTLLTATGNENIDDTTLLHGAVQLNSLRMINAIGNNGVNLKDDEGQTALNKLIYSNESTEVKRNLSLALLENGANPNIVAENGASPLATVIQMLYGAAEEDKGNYMSMFRDLLEHGADPNQKLNIEIDGEQKEITPAQIALQMQRYDTFELMAQSVEVANVDTSQDATTLTEALPCIEILEIMVDFGMDVMMKTKDFESVMEFAEGTGGLAIIRAVMEQGAGIEELTEMITASGSFDGMDVSSLIESITNNDSMADIESIISNLELADVDKETLQSIISDCLKEIEKISSVEAEIEAEEELVLTMKMFDD